jgi:hypothetical protein
MVLVGYQAESPWNELPAALAARSFQDPHPQFFLEGAGRETCRKFLIRAHII